MKKFIVSLVPIAAGLMALPVAGYADGHSAQHVCAYGQAPISTPVRIGDITAQMEGADGSLIVQPIATAFEFTITCATPVVGSVGAPMAYPLKDHTEVASLTTDQAVVPTAEVVAVKACGRTIPTDSLVQHN